MDRKTLIDHVRVYMKTIPQGPSYIFQIQAYNRIIKKIRQLQTDIISDDVIESMDITSRMKDHLKEFLKIKNKPNLGLVDELTMITGIGKKLAKDLIVQGVKTINDLKKKKFYNKLPIAAQVDIKYKPIKPIPRYLIEYLDHKWNFRKVIVGSYRRGKQYSNDIDILMLKEDISPDFISRLNSPYIKVYPPYSIGPAKISTIVRLIKYKKNLKVDFFITSREEYPFALLYATGSKEMNIKMRRVAKNKGWLLNQKGMFKKGKKIFAKSERDIFKALGLDYVPPPKR